MSKTAPVLKEHSEEESHATMAATSPTSTVRPIGMRSTMYCTCSGVSWV